LRLRHAAAVLGAKLAVRISQAVGHRGSSLPGQIALRINPKALTLLARMVTKGIVIVTGTNGKTTTNNMLAHILKARGYRVICNREGANMLTGVTAAFVRHAGVLGRRQYDFAVLEVDENSFPRVTAMVKPTVVVITNFFRDQLDRYGELDMTIATIRKSLKGLGETHLILNADDPLVTQLGRGNPSPLYYGVAPYRRPFSQLGEASREARFCPFCGKALNYSFYHYSQLGLWFCPGCGFKRPEADVEAREVRQDQGTLTCKVAYGNRTVPLHLPTQGFYNLYNALAAFTAGLALGVGALETAASLSCYEPATGRLQNFRYGSKQVFLNLVKNPAGFNESLTLLLSAPFKKDVFIAINDNAADGRDISWLWDVDFEALAPAADSLVRFYCSGRRAEEMGVRLKYAGLPLQRILIRPDLRQAVNEALHGEGEAVYFLATYTALWPVEKELRRLLDRKGVSYAHGMSSLS